MVSLDLSGKRVLIREDLNVPIQDGVVSSDARIRAALPTIQAALTARARVLVMSHLGRPEEGKYAEEFSLAPVAKRLAQLLGVAVPLKKDWLDGVSVRPGEVVLLAAVVSKVGKSLYEPAMLDICKRLLEQSAKRGIVIPMPTDVVVATQFSAKAEADVKPVGGVSDDEMILDIGPDSAEAMSALIASAGTILWNGPVGGFEFEQFAEGTRTLAKAIARSKAFSLAGGGDTPAAIQKYGIEDRISYISTGGGAFLELVEGKKLAAVEILVQLAA